MDMIKIDLYKYEGDFKTVNKQLDNKTTVSGLLHDSTEILTPQITIRAASWNNELYNYVFIPAFNRYYNVIKTSQESTDKITLFCSVDVLKTYETAIMKAGATVTSSDNGQPYISVRDDIYNMQPNFEKVDFTESELLDDTGTIIMVTIKGKGGQ